jgi:heat shock protein HspQ
MGGIWMTSLQFFLPYYIIVTNKGHSLTHYHTYTTFQSLSSEKDDYSVSTGQLVDEFEGLSKSSWLWASNLVYWRPWP